ncbi:MAG TPA: hypothetical protein ENJ53_08745, partial [Phaeodactylibacter sp.]|nr:hypothetical protein [Phaeodactylibacter sp.]
MILLNMFSWCSNCSWWLLPLLFGAWLLGYLLWNWTTGKRLKGEIEDLRANIKNWKTKFNDTEKELAQARYDQEKLNGEYATLKTRLANNDAKYRELQTSYQDLEAQGIAAIDTSKWTDRIADLESQLDISRNTNLKLQGDYATLKNKFSEVQNQVSEGGAALGIAEGTAGLSRISDLEKELKTSQSNYSELEASYNLLRANMEELKKQQSEKTVASDNSESDQARILDLEKELEAAGERHSALLSNYSTLQTNMKKLESQQSEKMGIAEGAENYESRIDDLEKKLAMAYENNAGMEADYAQLKADFGEMEMRVQGAPVDNSIEIEGYQIRIAELEQQLASQSEEESAAPGEAKKKKKKKKKKSKNKKKSKEEKEKKKNKKKKKKSKKAKASSRKKTGYGLVFGEDNLQIVEGIGPKIEGLLKEAGINTWAKLASTDTA